MSLKKLFIILFGIQFILVVVLMVVTLLLFQNQADLNRSRDVHFQSYLLADELRQSSDDLTRMARAYVVTGNPEFEREYWYILDIRNGKKPRPMNYNRIYWDFVAATRQKPRPDGKAISLNDLMIREGFTISEFDKLALARRNSDGLVNTEMIAMNAVKGLFKDASGNFTVKKKPDREMAIRIMNDEAYYKTKEEIMKPIDEFYVMFEKRTDMDVAKYEQHSTDLLWFSVVLIIVIMGMFVVSFVAIERQITARELAEGEINKLNTRLEQRVIERTAQLEAANKEMEAFTYSVSHDLRAPLRAINGFSKIISEDYAANFDDEGKRLLKVIRTNTQKMDQLIIDMLSLSRIGRVEIDFERIDMTTLANSIYHEIASPDIQEKFIFKVSKLPDAFGSVTLIRQVWSNLLSNAIKFTLPREVQTIEIGGYEENDKNIYFVKDSGVGFNPEYKNKLFNIFQRLHKADEFKGTGVGLAIVKRIIYRHGGKVWGEGKINEGATFYFSLPLIR